MTEQEREEAFAKEIKDVWEKMQIAIKKQGRWAYVTIIIANEFAALCRVFIRLYGKDEIDKYFPEEKDV